MSKAKKQTPAPEAPKVQPLNIGNYSAAVDDSPIHALYLKIMERLNIPHGSMEAFVVAAYELGQHDASVKFPIVDLEQLRNGG